MGDIKTKKRNRLGMQKLRDCALIKGEIRQQQIKEGTVKLRAKCNFGNKATAFVNVTQSRLDDIEVIQEAVDNLNCDDDSESEEGGTTRWLADGEESGFSALAHQFAAGADADSEAESDDSDAGEDGSNAGQRIFAGRRVSNKSILMITVVLT